MKIRSCLPRFHVRQQDSGRGALVLGLGTKTQDLSPKTLPWSNHGYCKAFTIRDRRTIAAAAEGARDELSGIGDPERRFAAHRPENPSRRRGTYNVCKPGGGGTGVGNGVRAESTADAQAFAEQQAQAKTEVIARMVQGSSALESQAVDSDTYRQMVSQTVHELMAGPRRRLWSPI